MNISCRFVCLVWFISILTWVKNLRADVGVYLGKENRKALLDRIQNLKRGLRDHVQTAFFIAVLSWDLASSQGQQGGNGRSPRRTHEFFLCLDSPASLLNVTSNYFIVGFDLAWSNGEKSGSVRGYSSVVYSWFWSSSVTPLSLSFSISNKGVVPSVVEVDEMISLAQLLLFSSLPPVLGLRKLISPWRFVFHFSASAYWSFMTIKQLFTGLKLIKMCLLFFCYIFLYLLLILLQMSPCLPLNSSPNKCSMPLITREKCAF